MAVYDFKCRSCNKIIEKHYKILDKPLGIVCPKCGEIALGIPSMSNFHLKGGGWYKDGYGDKK